MRAVAAPVAALLAVLAALLYGTAFVAPPAVAGSAPALSLTLTDLFPRMVTTDGPADLTVNGTLRNTGSVGITGVVIRVQRSDPLDTDGEVRDALDGDAATDAVTPQFVPLADSLPPGVELPVRLSVALRGQPATSLAFSSTGTYEVLVNVNAVADGGARARLAAVRLLLPVLGLPAGSRAAPASAAAPGEPTPFALLYPIAEVPARISTVPGAPVLLADDTLATSLAPGGRLDGLVTAIAQQATSGSPIRAATCLAIDPDLVETASLMAAGYLVVAPDGSTTKGTGGVAAASWLAQLRAAARGMCVIALPYADADLVALTRGGLGATAGRAVSTSWTVLATLLQTPVTPVTWPADGLLDDADAHVVDSAGASATVLSADGVTATDPAGDATDAMVALAGLSLPAVLADPLLTRAAAGPGSDVAPAPGRGAAIEADTPAGTDTPLSTQDTIGTLALRAGSGRAFVVAPPHRWAADGSGASALLAAAGLLIEAGRLTPRGLPAVLAGPAGGPDRLAYSPSAAAAELAPAAIAAIGRATAALTDLRSAVVPDSGVGLSADQLLGPMEQGLMRPASASRRADPAAAQTAAGSELSAVGALRDTVRVLEPPSPYTLGTSDAPLPLTVANGLPVTVRVRVEIASTSGLRVAPIDVQQIPPLGRRQVSVNAQAARAGQFLVEAAVRTPAGGLLGPPSRLHIQSTAYGTITGWLTASAGVIFVLLVVRRIRRRAGGIGAGTTARVDPTPAGLPPPTPPPPGGVPADAPTVAMPVIRDTDRLPTPRDLR